MRQIVLDTETTGLEVEQGHRIIEIGCVELRGRRLTTNNFHHYLQPDRQIDAGAQEVHGISNEDLANKPRFPELADALVKYLDGAELLIHNAAFDVGFLNKEFEWAGRPERIESLCTVTDTWLLAKEQHPGQRNSLDALCKRYEVDNSNRELHGALLDARLLADVYLAMTGGQRELLDPAAAQAQADQHRSPALEALFAEAEGKPLLGVLANEQELQRHRERMQAIAEAAGKQLWQD